MAAPDSARSPDAGSNPRRSTREAPEGMRRLFILRLRRLTWLRRSCSGQLDETVVRALDRAIYSTYCDCLELGLETEAHELLASLK